MKTITFYEPKYELEKDIFGAATLGFAGKSTDKGDGTYEFPIALRGIQLIEGKMLYWTFKNRSGRI